MSESQKQFSNNEQNSSIYKAVYLTGNKKNLLNGEIGIVKIRLA